MPFDIDFTGVQINGGKSVVPPGDYVLEIVKATEAVSKKGDPMVVVDYEVISGGQIGKLIKRHYVVFFKDKSASGAGMSKKFLKTIGLPCEGAVKVDPTQWIGRKLIGKVINEEVEVTDKQTGNKVKVTLAKVEYVSEYFVDYTAPQSSVLIKDEDDVPF